VMKSEAAIALVSGVEKCHAGEGVWPPELTR